MNFKTLLATALVVLTVAACGGAGSGSSNASGSPPPGAGAGATNAVAATSIHVRDFALDPKDVNVRGSVSLAVTNDGPTIHNVSIRDALGKVVGATEDLKPGPSESLTVDIPAGTYTLFCSLPGHESLGVKGKPHGHEVVESGTWAERRHPDHRARTSGVVERLEWLGRLEYGSVCWPRP